MNDRRKIAYSLDRTSWLIRVLGFLIIGVLIYSGIRNILDLHAYQSGISAYEAGNLEVAFEKFHEIDRNLHWLDLAGHQWNAHQALLAAARVEYETALMLSAQNRLVEAYDVFENLSRHAAAGLEQFSYLAQEGMQESYMNIGNSIYINYQQAKCGPVLVDGQWLLLHIDDTQPLMNFQKIQSMMELCRSYTSEVESVRGHPPELAARSTADFILANPSDPLSKAAFLKLSLLIETKGIPSIDSMEVCDALFKFQENPQFTNLADVLFACSLVYYRAFDDNTAITLLEKFIAAFPQDRNYPRAVEILAGLLFRRSEALKAEILPAPGLAGIGIKGAAHYRIRNNSPFPMQIVFSGKKTVIQTIQPCQDCITYSKSPLVCSAKGRQVEYSLPPGDYKILVETKVGDRVVPFSGEFTLRDGRIYSNCFMLVNTNYAGPNRP
jgi:hypothetical protein